MTDEVSIPRTYLQKMLEIIQSPSCMIPGHENEGIAVMCQQLKQKLAPKKEVEPDA